MLAAYRKFVVAAVGLAVVLGIIDEGTGQDIAGAIVAVLVYLIPNAE